MQRHGLWPIRPSVHGVSRQEYWSGLPCPSPRDFPDPGIEPTSFTSPALAGRFFSTSTTWEGWLVVVKDEIRTEWKSAAHSPRAASLWPPVTLSALTVQLRDADECRGCRTLALGGSIRIRWRGSRHPWRGFYFVVFIVKYTAFMRDWKGNPSLLMSMLFHPVTTPTFNLILFKSGGI